MNNKANCNWTDKEIEIISDTSKTISELCELLPSRSETAVGIKSRRLGYNRKEYSILRRRHAQELLLNKNFCEIIDGELLGDGCIMMDDNSNTSFTYSSSNQEYVTYLHGILGFMLESDAKISRYVQKKTHHVDGKEVISSPSYHFAFGHVVFKPFYHRWYCPKKHIPNDLQLTPTVCKHWYIGDGTIGNPSISLATHCFDKSELELVIFKMSKLGIIAKLSPCPQEQFCITIYARNVLKFLDYIG